MLVTGSYTYICIYIYINMSFTTSSGITMFTILLTTRKVVGIWFNCGFESVGQPRLIAKAARWRQEPKLITAQLKMAATAAPSAALQLLRRLQAWDGLWRVGFVMQLLKQIFEWHVFGTFTNCIATSSNFVFAETCYIDMIYNEMSMYVYVVYLFGWHVKRNCRVSDVQCIARFIPLNRMPSTSALLCDSVKCVHCCFGRWMCPTAGKPWRRQQHGHGRYRCWRSCRCSMWHPMTLGWQKLVDPLRML